MMFFMIFHVGQGVDTDQGADHRNDQNHDQGQIVDVKSRMGPFVFNQEKFQVYIQ